MQYPDRIKVISRIQIYIKWFESTTLANGHLCNSLSLRYHALVLELSRFKHWNTGGASGPLKSTWIFNIAFGITFSQKNSSILQEELSWSMLLLVAPSEKFTYIYTEKKCHNFHWIFHTYKSTLTTVSA